MSLAQLIGFCVNSTQSKEGSGPIDSVERVFASCDRASTVIACKVLEVHTRLCAPKAMGCNGTNKKTIDNEHKQNYLKHFKTIQNWR